MRADSVDAPLNRPEDEIPQRFIDGMGGDLKEARRWDITRNWRESEGVNTILQEKQPHFFTIQKHYPFYHCGRGKKGHLVFYERPGDLESAQLMARGITTPNLIRHWIFVTEYQWNVILGGDETAKSISVLDVGTVKMGDLAGENFTYVSTTIGYANAHYPERSYVIFIVNAPVWFSMLWKIIKPMVHENTQKKVRILSRSETLKGLQEHIDISQIPELYGGQCDYGGHDSCRFNTPDVKAMVHTNYLLTISTIQYLRSRSSRSQTES
jgi:CRAL/TRIO domain